jgi:maleate isomerase
MIDPLAAVRRPTMGIGVITPSGNVVVERVTAAVFADFPDVSGHFSRVEVVGSTDAYAGDYDWEGMLRAAELLSHAKPACICWNGSKGGTLGFDVDRLLCDRIQAATGVAATTSTLAIDAVLKATGARRIGLVTPYRPAYAAKIPPVFAAAGYETVAQAHAGVADNLAYAAIEDDVIRDLIRSVAGARPDAVLTYCTNFPAAHLVAALEQELGVPIYDSVSAGLWGALRVAGRATAPGRRWGSLFGRDERSNTTREAARAAAERSKLSTDSCPP